MSATVTKAPARFGAASGFGTSRRAARNEVDAAKRDVLESVFWLLGVGAIALAFTANNSMASLADALSVLGRATGIVAATMMMVQLLIIARVPVIERRLGHDRAALIHGQLGRLGFVAMIVHVLTLVVGYAARMNDGWWNQAWAFVVDYGLEMTIAVISFWLLMAVVATSLAAVRASWKYESWHKVHLLTYLVIALSIPHQFVNGTTFSGAAGAATDTFARWYWAMLWTVSVGAIVVYRIVRPVVTYLKYRPFVARVDRGNDGTITIWVTGRGLSRLGAQAGQFFQWRFMAPGLWGQSHPYSLSAAPRGNLMRVTVKVVGDGTAALANLLPGTPVMLEGPLGRFTLEHKRSEAVVLAGSGSGIAPIIALLDDVEPSTPVMVLLRASDIEQIPHANEVWELSQRKNVSLHVLTGPRGPGWLPQGVVSPFDATAADLRKCDLYVCGPVAWAQSLIDDAVARGLASERVHRDEFVW